MARLRSRFPLTAIAFIAALTVGCDRSSSKDDDAAPDASSDYDEARAAEYERLPETVLVGVAVDQDGRDVQGSGELRIPAGALAIEDDQSAYEAFQSAQPARVVASQDELDGDTSTQAWSSASQVTDYATYKPSAYSTTSQGQTYSYGEGQRYQNNLTAVYVYRRPSCAPPYCRPGNGYPGTPGNGNPGTPGYPGGDLDAQLAQALIRYDVRPLANGDWFRGSREQIELGGRLFNDKILSANGDVSCASCHADQFGTASIYSLGPSGQVLAGRKTGPFKVSDLLGRNTPPLYNLGHKSYTSMFWDARVVASSSHPSGFISPAGDDLPLGLANALAVQSLFPLIAGNEMGCGGASGMLATLTTNPTQSWAVIMTRVMARNDYRSMFSAAFPGESQPTIAHLANAIAAYEADRWRADNTPFDRYLRGDKQALTPAQKIGATYFYGKGNCASCHSGALLTDHRPHSIGIPQWGPGAGDGAGGLDDYGVGRISGRSSDRYKFRTPSLRNVAVTGPWGHNGAYRSLRQFIQHYTNTARSHDQWQPSQLILPQGFQATSQMLGGWNSPQIRNAVRGSSEIDSIPLTSQEIDGLVEFLLALTDPRVAHNPYAVVVNP